MPPPPKELIGRDDELARLDAAWANPRTHVVSIVAWGGQGKTALVSKWAAGLAGRDDFGASYFDWSFYSQGTRDQAGASSDAFVQAALVFFGELELAASAASAWDKGAKLAELVAARRTLLVLDGLEPLQYPPGPMGGELKDQAVRALLRGLAARNAGLCVVTTREPVADLAAFRDGDSPELETAPQWKLERLSTTAGVKVLASVGVHGGYKDMERLVEDVRGHALTLNLLGRYLYEAHSGDVRRRDRVRLEDADAEERGGHAFRVLETYEKWLAPKLSVWAWIKWLFSAQQRRERIDRQRPLAVLRLLGLFDRPADAAQIAALREPPAIVGLTDVLVDASEADWNIAVRRLEDLGLIAVERPDGVPGQAAVAYDAHPLVREYFARQLRTTQSAAWRVAHGRLFDYLCGSVEDQPDTIDGLQPLYLAVAHGCLAGRHEEAFREVYRRRIQRGSEFYSSKKLGAFGSDLGAVANFFDPPWQRVISALGEPERAFLMNEAAFDLRAVGRLIEALEPMRRGMEMRVADSDWRNAAISAGNLRELELTLGLVSAAVDDAKRGVEYADRSGDEFQRMSKRAALADALHQSGRHDDAAEKFREAEAMQAERQAAYPLLYSLQGFVYCDLLLGEVEQAAWQSGLDFKSENSNVKILHTSCRDVAERTSTTLRWSIENEAPLLSIALDHLTLSRVGLYGGLVEGVAIAELRSRVKNEVVAAVDGLRRAGQTDYIPRGLLTRGWYRAACGDLAGARADLDEAWEMAERGPMPLFMADVHLYRARLFGFAKADDRTMRLAADYPWKSARDDVSEARRLIAKHGYHRRDGELKDLERALDAAS